MNDDTKRAYRHLLYVAMLLIRGDCQHRVRPSWNPLRWRRQIRHGRVAGAVADWLHNLARYSAHDFVGFDEPSFWSDHLRICEQFPHHRLERFRHIFDQYLAGNVILCV